MLDWVLTDREDVAIATLEDRRLGRVEILRNGPRRANVTLSLDDPAALVVAPHRTLLKAWLDGTLVFKGRVTSPVFDDQGGGGEAGAGVTIVAVDPSFHLERAFTYAFNSRQRLTDDQSDILWALIDHVDDSDHGIIQGDLTATVSRNRTYLDGEPIWEKIVQLSEVLGGIDFELEPVTDDQAICRLNTFDSQGEVRPASFEYGFGAHNVSGFSYAPAGEEVCNSFWAVSTPLQTAYRAYSPGSINAFGMFEDWVAFSDITEVATLEEHAKEEVRRRAYPIEYVGVTTPPQGASADSELVDFTGAAFGQPPQLGPNADYWIGDTISVRARRNLEVDVDGRIEGVVIVEDEGGAVTVQATLSPIATLATDVTGEELLTVVE